MINNMRHQNYDKARIVIDIKFAFNTNGHMIKFLCKKWSILLKAHKNTIVIW